MAADPSGGANGRRADALHVHMHWDRYQSEDESVIELLRFARQGRLRKADSFTVQVALSRAGGNATLAVNWAARDPAAGMRIGLGESVFTDRGSDATHLKFKEVPATTSGKTIFSDVELRQKLGSCEEKVCVVWLMMDGQRSPSATSAEFLLQLQRNEIRLQWWKNGQDAA